ncbi:GNAT family N-acetyltransferase [Macrococcus equipercicus]|uniref:GNAT family N-acetyltransferase n=1 Tax=Macrococcus equipercicus TaxID=69967 RepID=A0A9Q9F1D2_9STAP|nr:GNAT family N-acetyltransferase [Macrococcus equipercicus]UTH13782.1 GNAT family N-acetyltransferase [Macrococcus equipercicus]
MTVINITEDFYFEEAMTLYGQTFPAEIRESEEVFRRSLQLLNDRYQFIGLTIDDQLAGFITFHVEKDYHIGFIVYLVVHPAYRGQHVASRLLAYAEERMTAIDCSLETIMLECEKDQYGVSPLESFYKKFNYVKYPIFYMQPSLQNNDPVPMNLFIKKIKKSRQLFLAITQMYIAKYHDANGIPLTKLQDYINNM